VRDEDRRPDGEDIESPWGAALLLALLGLVIRLTHNAALLDSPLYWHPLGGHTVFLKTAAASLAGDWLPGGRPFTDNSPLYPYLLALQWRVVGQNYLLTRFFSIVADSATVALVTLLGARHFGRRAGIAAGLVYACYAPAIFFSTELIYTPYAVLLSTAAAWWIESRRSASVLAAGLATGLAIDLMPSLVLGVPLVVATPFVIGRTRPPIAGIRPLLRSALIAATIAAAIAPVTLANWKTSGHFVLLTTGFGHAFYIGHNPLAAAGYELPNRIGPVTFANRGSIFDNMKTVASTIEGRELTDLEVSPWFTRKALAHIRAEPRFELTLAAKRVAALANSYEATTYGDFYFSRELSPLLRAGLTFDLLLPLAMLGAVGLGMRRRFALLTPIAVGVATVLTFFYLARFRMPMVPMLCVFAGQGAVRLLDILRARAWRPAAVRVAVAAALVAFARIAWATHDSANEWNKVGAVLMSLDKLEPAEAAFEHARSENPADPYAYLNLARVYEQRGDASTATEMRRQAALHLAGQRGDEFRHELSAAAPAASEL